MTFLHSLLFKYLLYIVWALYCVNHQQQQQKQQQQQQLIQHVNTTKEYYQI